LAEEAGGALTGPLVWVGAFRVDHSDVGRHRPHLPFPISYWTYVAGDVELGDSTTTSGAGEQVVSVRTLPPPEAIAFLAEFDDGPVTDVLRLAHAMGLTEQGEESARTM
jgi:8-oxo-dGTP diphosphatase